MNLTETKLLEKSEHYRKVRKSVYEEATKPLSNSPVIHAQNKEKLKAHVEQLANEAVLNNYRGTDNNTARAMWHHLWTINRFAGITVQIAATEVRDIELIFDEYEIFDSPEWDIEATGHNVNLCGSQVRAFLDRTGMFSNKQTVGNIPKLVKIVSVARKLTKFMQRKDAKTPVLDFITNQHHEDDVWAIHQHLMSLGYRSDLTVLHFLMTIGFQVIKPDIVISKLFLDWGWSHEIIPGIPKDLTVADLQGKGKYGQRYKYTNEKMYKPIIDLARQIVAVTSQDDLRKDIGCVTENPIREFDLFLVKYGQLPGKEYGIERTLHGEAAGRGKCITQMTQGNWQ